MDRGITIDLGGRGLEDSAFEALGEAQHVDGAHARWSWWSARDRADNGSARPGRRDCRSRRPRHRAERSRRDGELKTGIADEMLDIALGAGEEIIETNARGPRQAAARRDASRENPRRQ